MEQRPPPYSQPPLRPQPAELPPMRYGPKKTSLASKLKKIFGPLLLVVFLFVKFFAKIKFLILPLLKFFPVLLKTGGSMIVMIGVYAMMYGWKWAVGFVLLLLI